MNSNKYRALLILLLVALLAVLYSFNVHHYLSLGALRANYEGLLAFYQANSFAFTVGYFLFYVAAAALSIPGALILTLAAGAIFGLVPGLILVSFASSIGATLAFLAARFLFRSACERRFGARLAGINKGIEKEGAFYLFSLRLIPVIPFFLINILFGLSKMRALSFYWVSQLGMFAGTAVYVNAGTELGRIESVGDILSWQLALAFVLLGIFPLLSKKLLALLQGRRVYAGWNKPKKFDRNLIVIGAGSAGLVSAYIAAATKAKVTLIEANKMGGDCLNYGCVPSKALIASAKLVQQIKHAEAYGVKTSSPSVDFAAVMERVQRVIAEVAPHDSVERYTGLGVEVIEGKARMTSPWEVTIDLNDGGEQKLTSANIIIAAGAEPFVPPLPGLDQVAYLTSDNLWELRELPQRLVVLGGGPIGCELSQAFARIGSSVTQVEMLPRILGREDKDIALFGEQALAQDGVRVLTEHKALRVESVEGEQRLIVEHAGEELALAFDKILVAVGRSARLSGYGLEELGIDCNRVIETNEYLQTKYPNVYACGDCVGPYQFTHAAGHQAWYASVNALFGKLKRFRVDYRVMPWATFTAPEIARVGFNEQDAQAAGVEYEVSTYGIDDLDRAIADGAAHGLIKVLTVPGKDKILGVSIAAPHASELIAEFVLAMKQGLGLNKILGTIHAYPTWPEANKNLAGRWRQAHVNPTALRWVERWHKWQL